MYVCHAEMNAIMNKNAATLHGATMFVTMSVAVRECRPLARRVRCGQQRAASEEICPLLVLLGLGLELLETCGELVHLDDLLVAGRVSGLGGLASLREARRLELEGLAEVGLVARLAREERLNEERRVLLANVPRSRVFGV